MVNQASKRGKISVLLWEISRTVKKNRSEKVCREKSAEAIVVRIFFHEGLNNL